MPESLESIQIKFMKQVQIFDYIHNKIFGKDLIQKAQLIDINANGVQITGDKDIKKIALGVSCNSEFLEKAAEWGADCCIFHHGLGLAEKYGNIINSRFIPSVTKQLKIIFDNNMTIAGYHYLLDSHRQIGNNALIAKNLKAKIVDSYRDEWGYVAEFEKEIPIHDLAKTCSDLFKHDIFMVLGGREKIKRIGISSGGAIPSGQTALEIIEKKVDLHLTGEIIESSPSLAKDNNFNYFACGHYATEVFGIQALGEKINEKFPELDIRFIEVWNEI